MPPAKAASVLTGERREANKYITLSAIVPEAQRSEAKIATMKPVLNLLDIAVLNESKRAVETAAGGADMSLVEQALQQAILREWIAPDIRAVPAAQRRATLEITVRRDGSVTDVFLKTPSGSPLLDASIREATGRVTKIPQTLPSSFPKERYNLRVNFLIE
jgi:TonB family protein